MRQVGKIALRFDGSERMGPATGILNGIALSVGMWCTIASIWLLAR